MALNPARRRRVVSPRIAILPYGPSSSVNELKEGLSTEENSAIKLNINGSVFRGRESDLVINWGNSTIAPEAFTRIANNARVLNRPEAIRRASVKTEAFRLMAEAEVSTVTFTTDRAVAQEWLDTGSLVYSRTRLQGHSGAGIVMSHNDPSSIQGVGGSFEVITTLPQAPLYTKGINEQRREFRIHVMGGVVTYVQQKKRENGWADNLNYSNVVRNYHTGWIYSSADIAPNQAALNAAIASVAALGLDFGAVDVITRREEAWVLEVNTAPGLQGTNLSTYVENFRSFFEGNGFMERIPVTPATPVIEEPVVNEVPDLPTIQETRPDTMAAPQRATSPRVAGPRHGAFYPATINGERTLVQYNEDVSGYYMPGWEIPMHAGNDGFEVNFEQEVTW